MQIIISTLVTAGASLGVQAQPKPGDTTLPSPEAVFEQMGHYDKGSFRYQVSDFFAKPKQSGFSLSPDGKYLSYREKDANAKRHVYVKELATGEVTRAITEGEQLVSTYVWGYNNRLLYLQDKGGDENYELFVADVDGSHQQSLTPFKNIKVEGIYRIVSDPDHVVVTMNKEDPEIFEPFKLNIVNGQLEKLMENKDKENPIMGYDIDKDGFVRGYSRQLNGTTNVQMYRAPGETDFREVARTDWRNDFSILDFDYTDPKGHRAYVLSNLETDKSVIQLYDLSVRKVIKTLFGHPVFDAGGIGTSRARNYEIDYYSYDGDKAELVPVSAYFKRLYARFKKEIGDRSVSISAATLKEDKYLLFVSSDRLYGAYYTYDVASGKLEKMLDLMPNLKEPEMSASRPFSFTARDGLTVHGYITLPANAPKGQPLPMIVYPHGGPYGVRDSWGFDFAAQLFASRGYAVLQVNYRGSGGYGKQFFLAGSKQIGRNMLNDLEDGVQYAIKKGWAQPGKIGIHGGSYGGLATLGSLVKTPDLYACGVDYVGVSNLFTFFKAFPPYWKPFLKQVYEQWYDAESAADQEIMKAVSPALNIDKITKPLFIVQGANDPRVNIQESDQMVRQLRAKGLDVPYMVRYNEGHGFHHEDNSITFYKAMMGFFAQHLK
ncbi:S9 family peptidase [Chitinophaga pendula]|uniref:S9 family peptidase n=1 Tax=Chitinophaga TaxID=79328 RepID=UPI000BB0AC36|nr:MULTISPECIES: S9 family peptidase [Chitinophaga]ASZ15077.1 S9 family peptidase [Chitinophaga sp. MD30]UCJ08775.1 S9 family peptidase [Chitinophaga pendula]